MENRTYLVTEAEKLTGEKAHVLPVCVMYSICI